MSVESQYKLIKEQLPPNVKLVAVSKLQPIECLQQAYNAGARCFGESKALEFVAKTEAMPNDIEWHFIGHLQTNKVKMVVGRAALIQSVDSIKLLDVIEKEAQKQGICQRVLLQIHIAREETKCGFLPEELSMVWNASFPHICICGLMGMASYVEDKEQIHREFKGLRDLFDSLKQGPCSNNDSFSQLSMGMSGDYSIAIEEGSTMVRVGSAIFPPRVYTK